MKNKIEVFVEIKGTYSESLEETEIELKTIKKAQKQLLDKHESSKKEEKLNN